MSHTLTAKLYDLASNELADISGLLLEKTLKRRHNLPRSFTFESFAGHSAFTGVVAEDGLPNLRKGCRKLIVWEDGGPGDQPIFHGRCQLVERTGDGTKNRVKATFFDPLPELGYEGDDRGGRYVRGSTVQPTAGDPYANYDGNFINPKFASSVPGQAEISGPDLIFQALFNSTNSGGESDDHC